MASHPEFAARKTTKTIDGESVTGWFTEDFTLAELKTLRARERLPELRAANTRYDGAFSIPTFDEVLDLVAAADAQRAADARAAGLPPPPRIGIYPETKHPSYFAKLGLHFDDRMLEALSRHGYSKRSDPICLQSFEVANLKALRRRTDLPLVQLVAPTGQPFDFTLAGDQRTYLDLMSDAGLAEIATYADAIGPHKWMVVQFGPGGPADTRPGAPGARRRARNPRLDAARRERIPAGCIKIGGRRGGAGRPASGNPGAARRRNHGFLFRSPRPRRAGARRVVGQQSKGVDHGREMHTCALRCSHPAAGRRQLVLI